MPHTLETLKVTGKVTYEPNDFIESDCWIWNGATTGTKVDYGHVWDSRESRVHRLVFLLTYGHRPTPQAAHRCGHSLCFNPDHIYEATKEQNEADKRQHGTDNWGIREREKTRCPQDHPYSGDNLYVRPDGERECRICKRATDARYKQKVRS